MKPNRKAFVYAAIAVLFWATSPTAFKLGLRYQDSYQLLTGASLTSTLVLGIIILLRGEGRLLLNLGWKELGFSVLMGTLNPFVYYLILFKAYAVLPAQVAQPLNMIWPIVLVLISIPVLRQKISWSSIAAMFLSFSGVVLVSIQGEIGGKGPQNRLGIFLALSTSIVWAIYFILNAKDRKSPVIRLFLNFFFGSLMLLLGGIFMQATFPGSTKGWAAAVYVGIFEMGVTFVLWLTAMKYASTNDRIGNLVYLAPFLNLIIVNLVLHERIYLTTLYGIVLLVAGILVQNILARHATVT